MLPLLLALNRKAMLGSIIMSGLAIIPRSHRGRGVARRGNRLVKTKHRTDRSRGGAACPAQKRGICGFAEGLLAKLGGNCHKRLPVWSLHKAVRLAFNV